MLLGRFFTSTMQGEANEGCNTKERGPGSELRFQRINVMLLFSMGRNLTKGVRNIPGSKSLNNGRIINERNRSRDISREKPTKLDNMVR